MANFEEIRQSFNDERERRNKKEKKSLLENYFKENREFENRILECAKPRSRMVWEKIQQWRLLPNSFEESLKVWRFARS